MLYYLGKGTELKKNECREYKTLKNALLAAEKDKSLTVWDENGIAIDNITGGVLNMKPDDSVNTCDNNRNPVEVEDIATVAEVAKDVSSMGENDRKENKVENVLPEPENTGDGANTMLQTRENDRWQQDNVSIIVPQGIMKVTVACDGALNLRRSPAWGNENICGRAVRGQSYYVKEIHTVDGKKIVRTIDDIYLSGQSEHVQFEQL